MALEIEVGNGFGIADEAAVVGGDGDAVEEGGVFDGSVECEARAGGEVGMALPEGLKDFDEHR